MMMKKQVSLRLNQDLLDRAEKLIEHIDSDDDVMPGSQATVALVLRLAIYHGLSMWEAKYGVVK